MSNYKFKVGDTVRVLKTDDWSSETMYLNIGQLGIIVDCNDDDGINGYIIKDNTGYKFWYMEDSLELVKSDTKLNRDMISRKRMLELLQYAKEHKDVTIDDLILCVRELSCK